VPDYGIDKDILDSQKHEHDMESKIGHSWAPKWDDEKEKFKDMPTATADFKLTGTDADIRMMQEVKNLN